jgi:hypothetical protein
MLRRELARSFAVRLMITYLLLVIPWPGVTSGYGSAFRWTSNVILSTVGLSQLAHMEAPATTQPTWDVEMVMKHPQTGKSWRMEFGSRAWGYLPTAAALALVLAVPTPWSRRFLGIILILVLIHAFIAIRIVVALVYGFSFGGVISVSPGWLKTFEIALLAVSGTPIMSYAVPVILWLLVLYWTYSWRLVNSPAALES